MYIETLPDNQKIVNFELEILAKESPSQLDEALFIKAIMDRLSQSEWKLNQAQIQAEYDQNWDLSLILQRQIQTNYQLECVLCDAQSNLNLCSI